VKVINKARFAPSQYPEFKKEIELLQTLDHPNIVKGYDVFETLENLYIVMEFCGGGELFDRITARKKYSEKDAVPIMKQLANGVKYLHDRKIAHLDLKPDNLLFANSSEDSPLKIIDFGLSQFAKQRQYMTKFAGTSYYIAPEVLGGKYSFHADIWSMGVIMFILIFGFPPFHGTEGKDAQIHAAIRKGFEPIVKPGYGPWFPANMPVSDAAKDLMSRMLVLDQAKRITADEILEHPWISGEKASDHPLDHVMGQLKTFMSTSRFKANLLVALGDMLSDDEMLALNDSFRKLDKNGDGKITVGELQDAMKQLKKEGKEDEGAATLMGLMKADLDGDGALSYEELVAASVNRKLVNKEERLWTLFCQLDQDGDGKVSAKELSVALGKSNEAAAEMIKEVDKNGDGTVDYDEFLTMWMSKESTELGEKMKKPAAKSS